MSTKGPFDRISIREWLFNAHCLDTKSGAVLVAVGTALQLWGQRGVGLAVSGVGVVLLLRTLWVDVRLIARTRREALQSQGPAKAA